MSDKDFKIKKQAEMGRRTVTATVLVFALLSQGCSNLFAEMADKSTDKAKFYSAKLKIDSADWTGAITDILSTSATFQATREVRTVLAGAYAGRCGLDVIALANSLQNAGAASLFSILMTAFTGGTAAKLADCIAAETTLNLIGAVGTRTADENLLMAFASLAKMGQIISITGDIDATGTVDAAYFPCNAVVGTGRASLPDAIGTFADATELVTGLANFMTSIVQAGAGSAGGSTFTNVSTYCTTLEVTLGVTSFCSKTTRASVVALDLHAIRAAVVDNTGFGLAVNDGGTCDMSTCFTVNCALY